MLTEVASANIKHEHMKELDIPLINVILDYSLWQLSSEDTKLQRMKELDIPVISVICQSSVLWQHKASVHEGDFSQNSHLNGFSPVWIRLSLVKTQGSANAFSQTLHLKGFSPVWLCVWIIKEEEKANVFWHKSHLNCFSPLWLLFGYLSLEAFLPCWCYYSEPFILICLSCAINVS